MSTKIMHRVRKEMGWCWGGGVGGFGGVEKGSTKGG